MPHLFEPLKQRSITMRNRIAVSPMCQYSAVDGVMTDWHLVHLGQRAVGGAGLVMVEATGVEARGRISLGDTGIYDDSQLEMLAKAAKFIKDHGAVPAIQIAHAGRKASTNIPWEGDGEVTKEQGGWQTIAPSAIKFSDNYPMPAEMTLDDIKGVIKAFGEAARRAHQAGFEVLEIHGAHGYLVTEFLSPLSNTRVDQYGGSFDNRTRFLWEIIQEVRDIWPDNLPLWTRLSCTEWAPRGTESWDIEQSVQLSKVLKSFGVDLIDCSSGGNLANAKIPVGSGYQVPFAERIKRDVGIATGAVGMITSASQADDIIRNNRADVVLLAREMLRDPYWPVHAAKTLGLNDIVAQLSPKQYMRAW